MNKLMLATLIALSIGTVGFAVHQRYEGTFTLSGGGFQILMEGKPTTKN